MKPTLITAVLFFAMSVFAQCQTVEDSAAQRADELAQAITSGDRDQMRMFIQKAYTPKVIEQIPMERQLRLLSQLHDWTRGFEVIEVEQSEATLASAKMRENLTGWINTLRLMIEPESPYRLRGFMPGPVRPPAHLPEDDLSASEIKREVEHLTTSLCNADVFSGAVLVAGEDEVLFSRACGEANKDFDALNTLETKFNLGSMSKMFTAVAIGRLVETGQLSFDDQLSKYLPEFPSPEAAKKIKIKHLLSHTSGLGNYFNSEFQEGARSRFRTINDFWELVESDTLRFEPGTDWSYSNTGFLVLGKVIEKVTGQSYDNYVEKNIYEPVGMEYTGQYELDRVNKNLAVGYEKEYSDKGIIFRNNLFDHVIKGGPAGGGYSTVNDLMIFARALQKDKLISQEMFEILKKPKPDLSSPEYGYGFRIERDGRIIGHSGGFMGISSKLSIFPNRKYVAVTLSNYGNAIFQIMPKIEALLLSLEE